MNKLFLIIFSLILISHSSHGFEFEEVELVNNTSLSKLYKRWRMHYSIEREADEMDHRFNVFKDNVNYVYNTMTKPYNLKLNHFADLTLEEFSRTYGDCHSSNLNKRSESESGRFMYENVAELPMKFDWRDEGAVTPVKNQGKICRSCWVFSAVAAVEGINQITTNKLISLSEQEVVDCTANNMGCDPGFAETAFEIIKKNRGITTEVNYPYKDKVGTCKSNKIDNVMINDYERVTVDNETALAIAVVSQPVSVSLAFLYSNRSFMLYTGGVFKGPCGNVTNHAMTVVGYGVDRDGTKYWILKNSYGTNWGEHGYIWIEKDIKDSSQGRCGITVDAWYPIMKSSSLHPSTLEEEDTKHDEL